MTRNFSVVSPAYDAVIKQALAMQLIVGVPAALLLDGGVFARVIAASAVAFWLSVAVVLVRRPLEPTRNDLIFIRWGFWPILAIALAVQNASAFGAFGR